MLRRAALFILSLGCSSQPVGPAVTCSMQVQAASGSCDLIAAQPCSDGQFYEIDCQDDGACTCVENASPTMSFNASTQPAGYCATFDASLAHDLGTKCGWNLNP